MLTMKLPDLKILFCVLALASVACHATDGSVLSHEVINPAQLADKLNIDNVYRAFETADKQYYAGFRIDADGINHSLLIELDRSEKKRNRWEFDDIITDIFIFDGRVSVVLDSGKNYSLVKGEWVQNQQDFTHNARVVFSDGARHLIVCSPSSLLKANTHAAGCVSYQPDWTVSFPWYDVEPKVCGNFLYAVTWSQTQNQRLKIDLASGKIVGQKKNMGTEYGDGAIRMRAEQQLAARRGILGWRMYYSGWHQLTLAT